ncbi:coiled-coil domain-containing protein 158 isoform X3 [Callorhinchus milii]|uniref:coiled-coil domain-containing protein 158 isoform X3 n=1 Tax=Callorhinchus milii TaxID=7868 RepID=UPI001C3F5E59|nr:coiled-coil domain-containing protein 158 isoform X3 [Callorhinchus milii]
MSSSESSKASGPDSETLARLRSSYNFIKAGLPVSGTAPEFHKPTPRFPQRASGRLLSSVDSCQPSLHASETGKEGITPYKAKDLCANPRPAKNLLELRKELERQTQETKKLQEEVERASKLTMDKFSWTFNKARDCNLDELSSSLNDTPSAERSITSTFQNLRSPYRSSVLQASVSKCPFSKSPQSTKYDLDFFVSRKNMPSLGATCLDKSVDSYEHEHDECHGQQKLSFRQSMMDLQNKLQDVQAERDNLVDVRLKESQDHGELINKLHTAVQDLETVNRMQDETVRDANCQIEQLRKKAQVFDGVLNEIRQSLMGYEENTGKKVYEHENICNIHVQNMGTAVGKVLRDLEGDIACLKARICPMEDQLNSLKSETNSKTEYLLKQQHEREQAKNQASMYTQQIAELESTVSHLRCDLREVKKIQDNRSEDMNRQIEQFQCEIFEVKRERDELRKEIDTQNNLVQQLRIDYCNVEENLKIEKDKNQQLRDRGTSNCINVENMKRELDSKNMEIHRLDCHLNTLKEECQHQLECQLAAEKKRNEAQEKITSLLSEHERFNEQHCKMVEELSRKKQQLEKAEACITQMKEKEKCSEAETCDKNKLQMELEEKIRQIHKMKVAEESICDQFEEAISRLQKIQLENESLKNELYEKTKMLSVLRQEMQTIADMTSQQSHASEELQAEKTQLLSEVATQKCKIQELKADLERKDVQIQKLQLCMSELEKEKVKLINDATDKMSELRDLLQNKDQLSNELNVVQTQMCCLKEEHNQLKRSLTNKTDEYEWNTSKIKTQLQTALCDLEQAREAMKVLEGADTHAMKVAMGMQKQITAKRGQIDALQSKIHFLEDSLENCDKEKCYLKEEKVRLTKELSCLVSERNKIAAELDVMKCQEKRLRERLIKVETTLEKTSLQFSDCQSVIQRQEQDFMRLKLQHALEIKELQGPGYNIGVGQRTSTGPHCSSVSGNPTSSRPSSGYLSFPVCRKSCFQEDLNSDPNNLQLDLKDTFCDEHSKMSNKNDTNECEPEWSSRKMHAVDDLSTDFCAERRTQDSFRPFKWDSRYWMYKCVHELRLQVTLSSCRPKPQFPHQRPDTVDLTKISLNMPAWRCSWDNVTY